MRKPIEMLRAEAARQDGQFATAQALAFGVTPQQVRVMRRRGETRQLRRGVARFSAAAGDADPAITAVLACWPDGVISYRSAALYHGIPGVVLPREPEVTVPHGIVRKIPGVRVHWSRDIPAGDVLTVGAVRYMALARTLIDLADPDDPWGSLAMLDDVVAMGAKKTWVHHRAKALANGRAGVTLLRDATGPEAHAEFRSWLERAAAHVYRAGGLPDPEWNVRVRDTRGSIGIVDALWSDYQVVSETEGLRFHTSPSQRRRDANRFNRLLDADYRVRRFTWEDVVHRPTDVLQTLYRALRAAGADLDPVRIPPRVVVPGRPFLL